MDLANAAGSPYSAQQIINLAYILLNKTGKFTTGIREWNRIPQAQRTWDAFQLHFSQAHRELRESGELEIRETPFNTANIVQEVIKGVQQVMQQQLQQNNHSTNNSASNATRNRVRTKIDKYCWTHGACAHSSTECRNCKAGHKDAATFSNMMGGCMDFVNSSS